MGRKKSGPPDSVSKQHEEMPKAYQDAYHLLCDLVGDQEKRHSLASLQGAEGQSMVNFLNRVLEKERSQDHSGRVNVLHTLSLLAKSAQVFPECLNLSGLECAFDSKQVRSGSCSEVYKGAFIGGQVVCVKVVRGATTGYTYEQLLKVHAKEIILSAHMEHPNVLPFYGICDLSTGESKRVCIVSAWMDCDLVQYLKKTPNPPRDLLMWDIISGLEYMHGLDIIHSDLQAKNVLVSNEGRALLADFGASRVSIATRTGSIGGENWTSPELFRGEIHAATRESDMWAYACICYEIVTGVQPFSEFAGNIPSLVKAFKERRVPTHPDLAAGKVNEDILRKIKSCWDYDPSKRPSARDVCKLFRSLKLEDSRDPRDSAANSRASVDNTKIDYDVVLGILQRVQNAPSQ